MVVCAVFNAVMTGRQCGVNPTGFAAGATDDGLALLRRGCCVSTVGSDKQRIRKYIREQERQESGQGELDMKWEIRRAARAGPFLICRP